MLELIKKVERAVTYFLAGLMAVVVVLAVGELAWIIVKDIITPPVLILEIDDPGHLRDLHAGADRHGVA
jgi:hypothetical protein